MLARTFWAAFASGRSAGATASGDRQLAVFLRFWSGAVRDTASMRRGTVRAANMSPVPEKKRGIAGVSMRKRRGLKSEVAVLPMIVRFSTGSSFSEFSAVGLFCGRVDEDSGSEASLDGVCGCVTGRLVGIWLSWVRRSEVMITWGTR